jgi:hypothetical protein
MRFYNIVIADPVTGVTRAQYSSIRNDGLNDPSALKVSFDIPFFNSASPAGLAYVKIYGVDFNDIAQARQLNGANIIVLGGMGQGLPLANPQQQGIILFGTIYQAFGNWQGTEISLDLVAAPFFGTESEPVNLSFVWERGVPLSDLVTRILKQAFPASTVTGTYLSSLITYTPVQGFYKNIRQFADWVNTVSKDINRDPAYSGAQITQVADGFKIYDGSAQDNFKKLNFTDFIGNATWTSFDCINFKVMLRGDLAVGDYVQMPPRSNIINVVNSFSQFRDNISMQNNFLITRIRHLGDSRQPVADSWCTVIDAVVVPNDTQANQ